MLAMNCASQISIVLALLGFLAVEAASRSSAVRDRHCSLVTDVPAQVLQFVPPEKEDSKSSRERTDPTNGSLQKKSGDKQETLNCTHKSMLVQGSLREDGKRILVELRVCPAVRNMVLQLRSLGFIQHKHRRRVISCSRLQDTVILFKPSERMIVSIAPVQTRKTGEILSLAWNYEIKTNKSSTEWFYAGTKEITKDVTTTPQPPDVIYSECDDRWSSIRFGTPQCKHMECEYLLTYRFVNHTMLVIELSGKSDGWVALRLSSDRKMGGDEVIVCKKKSSTRQELEALSGWVSLPHSKPKRKSAENLDLVKQQSANGYIYCKMVRFISLNDVGGDTSLDLTANWYQMYAKGQVDSSGAMLQHSEVPPTTSKQISMLVPSQVTIKTYGYQQQVDVTQKTKHDTCAAMVDGSKLAAPRPNSCYPTIIIFLLLVWKLGV